MKKISIIGNGFVGNAIAVGLNKDYEILINDINPEKSRNTLEECHESEIFFVCVPTPSSYENGFDLSYVESVLEKIKTDRIVILKSTITPAAAIELINRYPKHRIVFNPEFLTERTAVEDFQNQKRIVLGGSLEDTKLVQQMYLKTFPNCKYILTDCKTACFIKYFCNCFFACKVSIMNEFFQVSSKEGINWEVALEGLLSSGWVNPMHTKVPGPDGDYGFGGKCFPKDILAFIQYSKILGIDPKITTSSWEKNLEIRKNKDWEKISGALRNFKEKK